MGVFDNYECKGQMTFDDYLKEVNSKYSDKCRHCVGFIQT